MVKASEVPKNLAPYVEVLGEEQAVEFFLTFGGAPLYLGNRPQARSSIAATVGKEKAEALAKRFGAGHVRVPTAKVWIARQLKGNGVSTYDIARRLHLTDTTVRGYLKSDDEQLNLF